MFSYLKLWLGRQCGCRRVVQIENQEDAEKVATSADPSDENPEQAKPKVDKLADIVRAHMIQ